MNYSLFDAFVILHGTDTMAYTSSALSFLLEDLGKTVVRFHQSRLARTPLGIHDDDAFHGALVLSGTDLILLSLRRHRNARKDGAHTGPP